MSERTLRGRRIAVGAFVLACMTIIAGCADPAPSATPDRAVGIIATGCDLAPEIGSGFFTSPGQVVTAAHVVAGADLIEVTDGTTTVEASIIAFDPDMDIAYLQVDGLATADGLAPITPDSSTVEPDDDGAAFVYRDGAVVELPVAISRRITLRTEDIHLEDLTRRPGFEATADIRPGDSGGVVAIDGRAVAIVWARSKRVDGRAYLVDLDRAGGLTGRQLAGDSDVGDLAERCA